METHLRTNVAHMITACLQLALLGDLGDAVLFHRQRSASKRRVVAAVSALLTSLQNWKASLHELQSTFSN